MAEKQVLVTGVTGFVGKAVALRALARGHRVRGLCRPGPARPVLSRASAAAGREPTGAKGELRPLPLEVALVYGDLADPASLSAAMQGCDWVLHCAGLNSFWERDAGRYRRTNVEGVRHVMEATLQARVSKVVHVSTAMAYGFPAESPFTEESVPGPHASEYARSKYQGDRLAWELHHTRGLPLVVVYLAAVVGAGDRKPVMQIGRFLEGRVPVMIDSPHSFTYVAIQDAAEAILRAAETEDNEGQRYLVGDQRLTTREYFQMLGDIAGVSLPRWTMGRRATLALAGLMGAWGRVTGRSPLMPPDLMRTVYTRSLLFDGSKAERELGLAYTPLRVALEEAVAYVREEGGETL